MSRDRAYTVSEAMTVAKRALEAVSLRVVGEISEFNDKPGYKAAYFTVGDESASMPCMMWRDAYIASGVDLTCGALVEMDGMFSAYVPKGRMQFMVKRLAHAGEGVLRMQVAALAARLETEGLMRPDRKRALPRFPCRIALVTSPRGKAVHDVIRTLRRRYPMAELLIAGVAVEGTGAPAAITAGLAAAVGARPDVILLVRGGGSYEDLMPFNDEMVARAVASSPVPVVTGIGHEPDTSIADMVADLRASTPTAAAEAVAPSVDEIAAGLDGHARRLGKALEHRVQGAEHRLQLLARRPVLCDVTALFANAWQAVDRAAEGLARAIPARIERDTQRLSYASDRLMRVGPQLLERTEHRVNQTAGRLEALSPLAILARGYAVAYGPDGHTILRASDQVRLGDAVRVRLHEGTLGVRVESTETEG